MVDDWTSGSVAAGGSSKFEVWVRKSKNGGWGASRYGARLLVWEVAAAGAGLGRSSLESRLQIEGGLAETSKGWAGQRAA